MNRVRALAQEEHPPERALAVERADLRGDHPARPEEQLGAGAEHEPAAPGARQQRPERGGHRDLAGGGDERGAPRGARRLEARERDQVSDEEGLAEDVVRARRERLGDGGPVGCALRSSTGTSAIAERRSRAQKVTPSSPGSLVSLTTSAGAGPWPSTRSASSALRTDVT